MLHNFGFLLVFFIIIILFLIQNWNNNNPNLFFSFIYFSSLLFFFYFIFKALNSSDQSRLILEIVLRWVKLKSDSGRCEEGSSILRSFLCGDEASFVYLLETGSQASPSEEDFVPLSETLATKLLTEADLQTAFNCYFYYLCFQNLPEIFASEPYDYLIEHPFFLINWNSESLSNRTEIEKLFEHILKEWPSPEVSRFLFFKLSQPHNKGLIHTTFYPPIFFFFSFPFPFSFILFSFELL